MSNIQNFDEMQKAFLEMQKALEKIQGNSNNVSKTNLILSGLLVCALAGLAYAVYKAYDYRKQLGDLPEKVAFQAVQIDTLEKRLNNFLHPTDLYKSVLN